MKNILKPIGIAIALALPGVAVADYPVSLHIDAANSNGGLALLSDSGWPVTIKMSVALPEGETYPAFAVQPNFPVRGNWGFLIFDDPDGCLNPPAPSWQTDASPECGVPEELPPDWDWDAWTPPPSDEVYMEFWPDVDMAGVVESAGANGGGNADRQLDLVDSAGSGGPEFDKWTYDFGVVDCTPLTDDPDCVQFGPGTGDEVIDGFGFGADDDITGLVVIAEYGPGLAFAEPDFDLTSPRMARNLAGLVNSVSYDLSDLQKTNSKEAGQKGKPTETIQEMVRIWAHINMLSNVVRNIIQYDACVGDFVYTDYGSGPVMTGCDGDNLWRVDGGPIETPPINYGRADAAAIDLLESTVFELRAFLVAGHAPNELADENGDGKVDSADAEMAGYTLLSNEDSIEFLQLDQFLCWGGGGNAQYFDLDGNGEATVPIVCPTGPGDLGRPPR
ncbi:MAG: hypothetical protein HKN58_01625 [Xanthomonadales bacterium]|nr:hypothetical protein [Xanthomonadales bacterium]